MKFDTAFNRSQKSLKLALDHLINYRNFLNFLSKSVHNLEHFNSTSNSCHNSDPSAFRWLNLASNITFRDQCVQSNKMSIKSPKWHFLSMFHVFTKFEPRKCLKNLFKDWVPLDLNPQNDFRHLTKLLLLITQISLCNDKSGSKSLHMWDGVLN